MAGIADLEALALSLPEVTRELSEDGRATYLVRGKQFVLHRSRRPDALDPASGERLDDVLMFRVADLGAKELILLDARCLFFTTPHFDGYPAVLLRIPDLAQLDREELRELIVEAWLTRAPKRVARAWLAEHESGGAGRRPTAGSASSPLPSSRGSGSSVGDCRT